LDEEGHQQARCRQDGERGGIDDRAILVVEIPVDLGAELEREGLPREDTPAPI
jgi:hypothetical protein